MTDSTLTLSTPEAGETNPIAPGQEALLDEYIAEQEAAQQQEDTGRILGKFNSQEDLARAYQELEKKLGQPKGEADPGPLPTSQGYTAEQAAEVYGQEMVETLAGKGLDMADVMYKADNGQDISQHYDALAEAFNVPRQVVENYVSKAQPPAAQTPSAAGLSDGDAAELKALVGGDQGFQELSGWAAQNLDQQELADYNGVVDSGNKDAIRWALKAMQSRSTSNAAPSEPKLISGGVPSAVERFESKQQVLDAMSKRNEKGQKLYEVDDAYRTKFMAILSRSEVF
jgi:hypothetical protein